MYTRTAGAADMLRRARSWLAEDPDPVTRVELFALIDSVESGDAAACSELNDRFTGSLNFGTAGIRGVLGAGPNRMNRAVVIRLAAGLATYLRDRGQDRVVVGYDARHLSQAFADTICDVLAGYELTVMQLPRALPTPVLAFAVRRLDCAAGVMVTASHNPATDNGVKVYVGDGSQIVAPIDAEISAHMEAAGSLHAIPTRADGWRSVPETVISRYVDRAAGLVRAGGPRDLSVAYTPLHGVGLSVLADVVRQAGFAPLNIVAAQAEPDPSFPTARYPNPEEPGAMDLVIELAQRVGADLVIANDPDADRCAVGINADGRWRLLTGDEVGVLLAHHVIESRHHQPNGQGPAVFANSIVSSRMLSTMATNAGVHHEQTLTGFKWVGRVPGLRFGYEEALGYCVDPAAVRDKDGISAALLVMELTAALKARGQTIAGLLDELALTHGLHVTDQLFVRRDRLDKLTATLSRLTADPPRMLAGLRVCAARNLADGVDGLPPTEGLRLDLESESRVTLRPSGTEPKLKCYFEVLVPADELEPGQVLLDARATAAHLVSKLRVDLRRLL